MMYRVSQDALDPLFPAIGQLILSWTVVESTLEMLIAIIYHPVGGKTHIETKQPGIPRVWSRKRSFLRRCFSNIEALAEYEQEAVTIFDGIAPAERIRHAIVHGVLSKYERESGIYEFHSFEIDQTLDMHKQAISKLTISDILVATTLSRTLAIKLLDLTQRVQNKFVPQNVPNKISRELAV